MAKKKKVEEQSSVVSRIDCVIADIRKQTDEEVSQLQAVRRVELSKAIFTLEEIEEIYDGIIEGFESRRGRHSYDTQIVYGVGILFKKIEQIAETKV